MSDNITWEQAVKWLRDQPEMQELVRACYYDDPLFEAAIRYETSEEWKAVQEILPSKTGDALDLGAGRGISSYAMAKAGWHVIALEPDPSPIVGRDAIQGLAEQTKLPIQPMAGYAENIPCVDSQFDLVYGRQVMHHAKNLQKMCNEIARVLKPGGMFIATREHVIHRKEDLQVFLNNHPLHHLYGGENAYLLAEYRSSIYQSGLKLRKIYSPLETVINYFPMDKLQWRVALHRPVKKWLGVSLPILLSDTRYPWAGVINRLLALLHSTLNDVPGRLYTFVAYKKR